MYYKIRHRIMCEHASNDCVNFLYLVYQILMFPNFTLKMVKKGSAYPFIKDIAERLKNVKKGPSMYGMK